MNRVAARLATRVLIAFVSPTVAHATDLPIVPEGFDLPIFPRSGGELCCCPTQWMVSIRGKPYCRLPADWNSPIISRGQFGAPIVRPEHK